MWLAFHFFLLNFLKRLRSSICFIEKISPEMQVKLFSVSVLKI